MIADNAGRRAARCAGILTLVAILMIAWSTGAARSAGLAGQQDPSDFVQEFGTAAVAMVAQGDVTTQSRERAFRELFIAYFDVEGIGRFVLGPHWRRTKASERAVYRQIFEDFIVATYARRLADYGGERLEVGPGRESGERDVLVPSKILRSEAPPVEVDWHLRRFKDGWRIVDLRISGISMALTRRAEFSNLLQQTDGLSSLLEKLKELTERARSQA